jgi:hypothetical protein
MEEEEQRPVGGSGPGFEEVRPGPGLFLARVRVVRRRAARLEAALARNGPVRAGGPAGVKRDRLESAKGGTS